MARRDAWKSRFRSTRRRIDRVAFGTRNESKIEEIALETCDQYTVQGNLFAQAVFDGVAVPTPLDDAVRNMQVIEAIVRSAESGAWVEVI